jgi:hypothetical protein
MSEDEIKPMPEELKEFESSVVSIATNLPLTF